MVVRTGPAAFNIRMMSRFRSLGMRGHAYGGVTGQAGETILCPTEAQVFELLGWPYLDPGSGPDDGPRAAVHVPCRPVRVVAGSVSSAMSGSGIPFVWWGIVVFSCSMFGLLSMFYKLDFARPGGQDG